VDAGVRRQGALRASVSRPGAAGARLSLTRLGSGDKHACAGEASRVYARRQAVPQRVVVAVAEPGDRPRQIAVGRDEASACAASAPRIRRRTLSPTPGDPRPSTPSAGAPCRRANLQRVDPRHPLDPSAAEIAPSGLPRTEPTAPAGDEGRATSLCSARPRSPAAIEQRRSRRRSGSRRGPSRASDRRVPSGDGERWPTRASAAWILRSPNTPGSPVCRRLALRSSSASSARALRRQEARYASSLKAAESAGFELTQGKVVPAPDTPDELQGWTEYGPSGS
jgi:hypothetical protein